jgi:hypothetical protein
VLVPTRSGRMMVEVMPTRSTRTRMSKRRARRRFRPRRDLELDPPIAVLWGQRPAGEHLPGIRRRCERAREREPGRAVMGYGHHVPAGSASPTISP